MARPRTVGVSVTPEARDALNDLVVQVITVTRGRVTQSDALRVAARLLADMAATDPRKVAEAATATLGEDAA